MSKKITRKQFLLSLAALGVGATRVKSFPTLVDRIQRSVPTQPDPLIIKAGAKGYDELRNGFNKRISHWPTAIALCKSTDDAVASVTYAKNNSLPISIRSGGHSFEGYSSNDGSLVIDFSGLDSAVLQRDGTLIAGPGCRLAKLYDTILPHNRIIPAGSCGGVGLGGLALGGGYGFFSRKFGLTCDSLIDATVVDTKGNIHSAKDDAELLWALRGGGTGGLGIVTSMMFETHAAPATFTSHHFKSRNLNATKAQELMEAWFTIAASLPVGCFSAFVLNGKTLNILLTDFENGKSNVDESVTALRKIMGESHSSKPIGVGRALKQYYGRSSPLYFKNSSAGLYKDFSDIKDAMPEVLGIVLSTPGMIYQINTLGGNINSPKFVQGSAFPHRAFGFLSELQTYWESPNQEAHLLKRFGEVQKILFDSGIRAQYSNYPSAEFKDSQSAYYGANYNRLQAVKRRLDPENLINHAQSIQP